MKEAFNAERALLKLPIASDWASFKGEIFVVTINFEATTKAKKPMVDLAHCLTYDRTLKTVQWDKSKFKPCHLSGSWEPIIK